MWKSIHFLKKKKRAHVSLIKFLPFLSFIFLFIFYLIKKKDLLRTEIPFYDWYNLDGNTGTSCLLVMLNCTLKVHLFQQILHIM